MTNLNNLSDYREVAIEAAELYNRGDNASALEKFKILANHNPGNFKVHETLSYIYLNLEDVQNAEREYRIALDIARKENDNFVEPMTFDDLIKKVGDPREVEQEFIRLMKEEPSNQVNEYTRTAIHLGILYMSRGDYKKAEQILTAFKKKYEVVLV